MKPILEQIRLQQPNATFFSYRFEIPFFEFKWHYHPEYELTYIVKGNGFRLVGNSYASFGDGDLVLIGPNLPHTWVGKSKDDSLFEAVVLQFSSSFIASFLGFEESDALQKMVVNAQKGLFFTASNEGIKNEMIQLTETSGFERILSFLSVLNQLSAAESVPLTTEKFVPLYSLETEKRINKVCGYLEQNFTKTITLAEVANLISLSESNFCKFFKKATGKTFSDYLNDIRIQESCQILLKTDLDINQIAMQCGYESLSYFNRIFLKKKGLTPRQFRQSNLL